jgi:hypothetical protein
MAISPIEGGGGAAEGLMIPQKPNPVNAARAWCISTAGIILDTEHSVLDAGIREHLQAFLRKVAGRGDGHREGRRSSRAAGRGRRGWPRSWRQTLRHIV